MAVPRDGAPRRRPTAGSAFALLGRAPSPPQGPLHDQDRALRDSERWWWELDRRASAALDEPPRAFGPATERLFDLLAESDLLPLVAPRGRLGSDLAGRCRVTARQRLRALRVERAALELSRPLIAKRAAIGASPRSGSEGEGRVRGRGSGEGAASAGERGSDSLAGSAAAEVNRDAIIRARAGPLARLRRLAASYPGEPEEGLRDGEVAIPGTRLLLDRRGSLIERPTLPGSMIVLGPRLVSGKRRLRVAVPSESTAPLGSDGDPRRLRSAKDPASGLGRLTGARPPAGRSLRPAAPIPARRSDPAAVTHRRLGKALAIIDAVWPEAGAEIRRRTRLVLPLEEPGLVSFSLASRPGVSFINVGRKTLVDLADDLLHESAHHRLHAIERTSPLFTRRGRESPGRESAGDAAGTELRYWSPWRRAPRPVRGIYHACYTFAFRAELFDRIVGAARGTRGHVGPLRLGSDRLRWLAREAAKERRWIASSLLDLRDAARRGALTSEGRALLRPIGDAART